jgi:D-alanyl-D-alanine dipeptidase
MGSAFDHFGPESHITAESRLLLSGAITQQELDNRKLLRRIMKQQGLQPLNSEWWHFNLMSRAQARQRLRVVE